MPETLAQLSEKGRAALSNLARQTLDKAFSLYGKETKISFPVTNYYLPLINSILNVKVKTLADLAFILDEVEKDEFLPFAEGILNKGFSVLACMEVLAALAVFNKGHPLQGSGFIPDSMLRSLGLKLIDGRVSAIAVILGPAKDVDSAVSLIREFKSRGIVSLLAGNINGNTMEGQLKSRGLELGLDNGIIALGSDYLSAIYAVNFIARFPLIYGNFQAGQCQQIIDYIRKRILAFCLLLGTADEEVIAYGLGVMVLGMPLITDLSLPQLDKIDATFLEALVVEKDYKKIPSRCMLARGIKPKIINMEMPLSYAAAFEGEKVRDEELQVEFGGKANLSFELLVSQEEAKVEDGRIEVFGPDLDSLERGNRFLPLAVVVNVYGRKMQKDFESMLERQIDRFINYACGIMHEGQRDNSLIRVSCDAFSRGFRLKDLGVILHAMFHREYSAIIDKVEVRLYTDKADVDRLLSGAREIFSLRDKRMLGLTDEGVGTYYSCLICQSITPNHVCILTPQRPGLCGAYSWLDAKISSEIVPTGPNQPILKGKPLDLRLGQWESINKYVRDKSNKTIEKVSIYSIVDSPQTSSGYFECILAVVPEVKGVMVVNRDYPGMTPCGMSFSDLSALLRTGAQVPGLLGISKLYILSRKFISAEGGLKRLVWMPKELKKLLGKEIEQAALDIGEFGLLEEIADEDDAVSLGELESFLSKANHPSLCMDPLI
ncbi:MAG: acetyl-CoA decarbonylase/synthase complex subunit alpha/beta [Candidatus Omnitrophica bacterium]|nr:acetyl-CoA decarbonylase/synthase complex subunit alpha/beta [Candidatus Omnitrophota bacterium]